MWQWRHMCVNNLPQLLSDSGMTRQHSTQEKLAVQCWQGKCSCLVSVEYVDGICFLPLTALLLDDVSWLQATWHLVLVITCCTSTTSPDVIASLSSRHRDSINHEPRVDVYQLCRPASQTSHWSLESMLSSLQRFDATSWVTGRASVW